MPNLGKMLTRLIFVDWHNSDHDEVVVVDLIKLVLANNASLLQNICSYYI